MDNTIKKYSYITAFQPTEEKIELLKNKLLTEPLYLTDEARQERAVYQLITYYMYASRSVTYEFKDYGGILWFVEIIPGYKADVIMKLWDKKLWGPTLARDLRRMFPMVMRMYNLKRLSLQTPSESGAALAKFLGFTVEGRQKFGFRWEGKMMTNIMLRKVIDPRRK